MTLRIGLSSCFLHPDPERHTFKGKTLLYAERSMLNWIAGAGVLVYPVPPAQPGGPISPDDYVDDLDGLVLHGGSDVSPTSYGEEPLDPDWHGDRIRDEYEIDLLERFLDRGKPVLGICRGLQVLNVAFGGTLWQDLRAQGATDQVHRDQDLYDGNFHEVRVLEQSKLAALLGGGGTYKVNSIHHQGIKDPGRGLTVEALAPDGIIEAIRSDRGYAVGVQWHPEFFDPEDRSLLDTGCLLREFLTEARRARDPGREEVPTDQIRSAR